MIERHHTANPAIQRMRELNGGTFRIGIHEFEVHPNVWNPAIDWSGSRAVDFFPSLHGCSVVDIGCGSGIGCAAAILKGAVALTGVDFNPSALKNTRENIEKAAQYMEKKSMECTLVEEVAHVQKQHDFIYYNPPFHSDEPEGYLEAAVSDLHYSWMQQVFEHLPRLIKPGGKMVAVFSETGDESLFEGLLKLAGFFISEKFVEAREGYPCSFYKCVMPSV